MYYICSKIRNNYNWSLKGMRYGTISRKTNSVRVQLPKRQVVLTMENRNSF